MTRINVGIDPRRLPDKLLLAEHREIKRIPNAVFKHYVVENKSFPHIPPKFILGRGHVTFFYNKLNFLWRRYIDIHNECISRGFNVKDYYLSFLRIPYNRTFFGNYKPTERDVKIIKGRLREKGHKLLK